MVSRPVERLPELLRNSGAHCPRRSANQVQELPAGAGVVAQRAP